MPSLKPSSASIRAPSAKVTEDCLDDDGVKTAVTPAIAFSGPELAGAAPWNTDGRAYTLQGGSLARTLGGTLCSGSVGNDISSTFPPNAGGGRGADAGHHGTF